MKSRRMVVSGLMLFAMMGGLTLAGSAPTSLAAAPAMLAEFTWTGEAGDDLFSSHCNWHPGETCSFTDPVPGDGDNATFPTNGGTAWAVDLVTVTIDNLTLEEDVDFGLVDAARTLTVDKLVIVGDEHAGTVVTMTSGGEITIPIP